MVLILFFIDDFIRFPHAVFFLRRVVRAASLKHLVFAPARSAVRYAAHVLLLARFRLSRFRRWWSKGRRSFDTWRHSRPRGNHRLRFSGRFSSLSFWRRRSLGRSLAELLLTV